MCIKDKVTYYNVKQLIAHIRQSFIYGVLPSGKHMYVVDTGSECVNNILLDYNDIIYYPQRTSKFNISEHMKKVIKRVDN